MNPISMNSFCPVRRFAGWLAICLMAMLLAACDGASDDSDVAQALMSASITTQPTSAKVTAPDPATFTVTAMGDAPLTYQWFRNGVAIDGATAANYTTGPVGANDDGARFKVIVSNAVASVTSSEAALTVQAGGTGATAGPAAARAYVLAGLVNLQANIRVGDPHYVLYLVDPAHPETTSVIEDFGNAQPLVVYADAYEKNGSARTSLYKGAAQAFYVKNDKLWAIDLIADHSHLPRQVSATSVCSIQIIGGSFGYYVPIDSSAEDIWLQVNDCSRTAPRMGRAFIRSSMGPQDSAITQTTSTVNGPFLTLSDLNGNFNGGIAEDGVGLSFYDKEFVLRGSVSGSVGLKTDTIGGVVEDNFSDRKLYIQFGSILYRISWTDVSAALQPVYTFQTSTSTFIASDADAIYFADGLTLFKIVNGADPQSMITLTGAPIALLLLTDDRIIVQQSDRMGNARLLKVTSISKLGADAPIVLAATEGVVIGTTADSLLLMIGSETRSIKADGTGGAALPPGRPVYDPLQRNGLARIAVTLTCKSTATASSNCSNGTIEETLLDGTTLTLGQVAHAVDYPSAVFGSPTRLDSSTVSALGFPELITFYDARAGLRDLYLWRHGQAGSLVRLTNNVP